MRSTDIAQLQDVIDRFADTPIVVVGDLILDHYIWGKVNRISPEAPVVVVHTTEENRRPGGAGNVVNNLVSLGARVAICGVVGDDDAGRTLVSLLDDKGVDVSGVLVDRSRPTTLKTRVVAHAQQVVRVDREDTKQLSPALAEGLSGAFQSKIDSVKGVIISDYGKSAIGESVFGRIEAGCEKGVFGYGKIPVVVDPKAPHFSLYRGATVIKPNRGEAEEASGQSISDRASALQVGQILLEKWGCEMVLITLGEDGMVLASGIDKDDPMVEIDTIAREVYDVSGAGDTVSAVLALALAVKGAPRQAAELANLAAGIVVGEVGTVAVNIDQLRAALANLGD